VRVKKVINFNNEINQHETAARFNSISFLISSYMHGVGSMPRAPFARLVSDALARLLSVDRSQYVALSKAVVVDLWLAPQSIFISPHIPPSQPQIQLCCTVGLQCATSRSVEDPIWVSSIQ
jgi:hypothetical protein